MKSESPKPNFPKEIELPSGRKAKILRKPRGRDAINANRAAGSKASNTARMYALLAEVTEIDGKQVVMEDFAEIEIDDIAEIAKAAGLATDDEEEVDRNFLRARPESSSSAAPTSPHSSGGASQSKS